MANYRTTPFADIALAGLTFNVVHLLLTLLVHSEKLISNLSIVGAVVAVILQFVVWFFCLLWSKGLKANPIRVKLFVSYGLGVVWFVISTGAILVALP